MATWAPRSSSRSATTSNIPRRSSSTPDDEPLLEILATPIINWPEVAILGVHKIEKRPVVRDDQIAIREMMYLSCSFDHRVIDGHVGAAFVQSVRNYLEHPATIFVDTGRRAAS